MTCAQTAIMPTNKLNDASAATSSANIFNITASATRTYKELYSRFVLCQADGALLSISR